MQPCVKCGSTSMASDIRLFQNAGKGPLVQFVNPALHTFTRIDQVPVRANICLHCGYTEFFTELTDAFREHWQTNQDVSR